MPRHDIAQDLRKLIAQTERQGTTRAEIARRADLPRAQVMRIATGENLPRLDTAARIAKAIGYRLALLPVAK